MASGVKVSLVNEVTTDKLKTTDPDAQSKASENSLRK